MKGKISKIKNTEDELLLPITTAEAVYMEDGETKLNDEIKNINSSLETKANEVEVRKKNIDITLNDCDSNMLGAIQGGEGTSFELLSIPRDGSVTLNKTDFIEVDENYNIFVKGKAKQGGYYNPTTGAWIVSENHGVSDFIPCKSGDKITQNGKMQIIYWDSSKQIISSTTYPSPVAPAFTIVPTNDNIAYFTIAFTVADINSFIVVKNIDWNNTITVENAHKSSELKIYNENLSKDFRLTTDKLEEDVDTFFQNVKLQKTDNLIDLTNLTSGYPNPTTGAWIVSANHWTSDYIPTQKLKTYTQNSALFTAYYDSDKKILGTTSALKTKTLPDNDNIAYIRAVISANDKADLIKSMFVEGTVYPTYYIPYQTIKFTEGIFDFGINVDSKLKGLTWNVLGDSITFGGGYGDPETNHKTYHQLIAEECGCTVNNYGVGGTTITIRDNYTDSFLERYASMSEEADIITVFGGVNDLIKGVPIGTFGNGDNKTFYGAFEELIVGLINKYPDKIVAVILPCQKKGAYDTFLPYIEAEEKICQKYSIPYVDIFRKGGLCADIQTDYYDSYGTHPWTKGVRKFAPKIKNFLENLI